MRPGFSPAAGRERVMGMWLGGAAWWMLVFWLGVLVLVIWLALTLPARVRALAGALIILGGIVGMSWVWTRTPRPIPASSGVQLLTLRMVDFAFQPSVVQAVLGASINLELINSGDVPHTLVIPGHIRVTLLPGERTIVGMGTVEPGVYDFFCAFTGHRRAGMSGTLVVGPEGLAGR